MVTIPLRTGSNWLLTVLQVEVILIPKKLSTVSLGRSGSSAARWFEPYRLVSISPFWISGRPTLKGGSSEIFFLRTDAGASPGGRPSVKPAFSKETNRVLIAIGQEPTLGFFNGTHRDVQKKTKYFILDEDTMCSKRESELVQEYLNHFGCMPTGEGEDDCE